MWTDGSTDWTDVTKVIVAYHNFAKALKNKIRLSPSYMRIYKCLCVFHLPFFILNYSIKFHETSYGPYTCRRRLKPKISNFFQ